MLTLDYPQTVDKLKEIMNAVKEETGHFPTRGDVLRELPPIGVQLTRLADAYDEIVSA